MICAWAPGATTGKSSFGLRGAYAELTPILCSNPETKIASECLATNAVQHYVRQTVLLFSLLVTGMRYSMAVSIVYYR